MWKSFFWVSAAASRTMSMHWKNVFGDQTTQPNFHTTLQSCFKDIFFFKFFGGDWKKWALNLEKLWLILQIPRKTVSERSLHVREYIERKRGDKIGEFTKFPAVAALSGRLHQVIGDRASLAPSQGWPKRFIFLALSPTVIRLAFIYFGFALNFPYMFM